MDRYDVSSTDLAPCPFCGGVDDTHLINCPVIQDGTPEDDDPDPWFSSPDAATACPGCGLNGRCADHCPVHRAEWDSHFLEDDGA